MDRAYKLTCFIFTIVTIILLWLHFSSGKIESINFDLQNIETTLALIELALVILIIFIAIGAIFGFWMIREAAVNASKETAAEEARKSIDKIQPVIEEKARDFAREAIVLEVHGSESTQTTQQIPKTTKKESE